MSRTYRKRANSPWSWRDPLEVLVDEYQPGDCIAYSWRGKIVAWRMLDPKSKQGRKNLAKARRDKVWNFKEPGPSWFRRLFTQRPYRQDARRQIRKFLQNEDYEPMILSKPKLEYWT